MLKHIVMWKFKDGENGVSAREHAIWMKEHLEALVGVVPELKSLECGINDIPNEGAYDAVLTTCFENQEDLKKYKVHPKHKEIMEYCKNARISRCAVDYYL